MEKQLGKTCVACGLQKPMTAFLQITGPEGSSYGNVCSTCRGSGLGKKITIAPIEDEHSSSSTGLKIDAKAKQQIDRMKKLNADEKEVKEHKEEQKNEKELQEKLERKETKAEEEKNHRLNYIEQKKDSFLNYKSKPAASLPPKSVQQKANEQHIALDKEAQVDLTNKSAVAKAEDTAKGINLGTTFVDSTTGEIKYHSAEFLKMRAWLGNSAAINTIERQFLSKKTSHMQNPSAEDKLVEFLGDTFEPNKPKTRR
jgi:hypothetical protein